MMVRDLTIGSLRSMQEHHIPTDKVLVVMINIPKLIYARMLLLNEELPEDFEIYQRESNDKHLALVFKTDRPDKAIQMKYLADDFVERLGSGSVELGRIYPKRSW